ncbi:RNA 3'-terminal phosphate cyclase [Anticarsia gemmatalis]|uniref:RNA 3'-terminal phosphate cyclase n=1 Tax=Anticarsia gemmatalis TaxID=129554 RepID=UPI003F75A528
MTEYMEIDGSILEGGGQILRISVALSAILTKPIRVTNIRAGRRKPGLAAQHLVGMKLVADMCGAKLAGASIGSMEVRFAPGRKISQGHYVADTRTAGSISLLLQVALPCALMADGPVSLDLKGGTNADMAPQIDYITNIFLKYLQKFGIDVDIRIVRRGYFPKGGGHVTLVVNPMEKFRAATILERGDVLKVYGWSFVAGTLPMKLAHQMVDGVKEVIMPSENEVEIKAYKEDARIAPDNCSGIVVVCETTKGCYLGADGLGKRGALPLDVGLKAGHELLEAIRSGACVDNHTQDQLILYMALAEGKSAVRCGKLSLHTRTAMHFAERLANVRFVVTEDGEHNVIECFGMSHVNKHFPAAHWPRDQPAPGTDRPPTAPTPNFNYM